MSFDLMVFEKANAPMIYEDFLNWANEQTNWAEDRDFDSLEGTAPRLSAWFKAMSKTFPPMNGPYCLSDAAASAVDENRFTDYSIGSSVIYAAFAWSEAEAADELASKLAREHNVGFFNPQTAAVFCAGMVLCKIRTERSDDQTVVWEQIEATLCSLDDPKRGTSPSNGAFVTVFFEQNGTEGEFLQCAPDYPPQKGFLKSLFGSGKNPGTGIQSYTVEAGTGARLFSTKVNDKEQLRQIFHNYYLSRRLPNLTNWQDTGLL